MKKLILTVLFILISAGISFSGNKTAPQKEPVKIKIATIAPSGSYDKLKELILEKTGNQVDLKFYYGGIQGDAKDVLRKIRFKQLHGATLSGYGLGQIVPESRITNIPYVFRNYGEIEYVRGHLEEYLNKEFEKKGFIVLGWYDLGFIYTFSKVPITSLEVARQQKFWVPENDVVANTLCEVLEISPISLSITDVMTSLSTRLIDAASAPPLAAVALRWYTRFKYMSEYPMGNVVSALVVTKQQWNKIPPEDRKVVMETSSDFFEKAKKVIREKNKKSIQLLKKAGIQVVGIDREENKKFIQMTAKKTSDALVGKMFSQELLDRTMALLNKYREMHPDSSIERITGDAVQSP